ncbi:T9SS type A sorting domain-containing protein [candidate division WOR-3 bacterium]|nr:T9SS type A sorting domain-containing protein [candidate division WOR-3 bacterium]
MVAQLLLLLLYLSIDTSAQTITHTFTFSSSQLQSIVADNRTIFTLPDAEIATPPGAPALPVKPVNLLLPSNSRVTGIKAVSVEYETLPQKFDLATVPVPNILSLPAKKLNEEQPYRLNQNPYPESVCVLTGTGFIRGKPVASLLIFPLQLLPETNQVRLIKRISIALEQKPQPSAEWAETGPLEYLIVTTRTLDTVFAPLVRWRQKTGLNSACRAIEWITANYQGQDPAEKLRNYLRYCAQDSGLKYLLLGGDVDLVPVRKAFAMACSAGLHPREDSLPCDLYYSCLDGNWDADGDNVYGETEDSVDLYPDIYVGRVPANSLEEAHAFVSKLIAYETGVTNDYQTNTLLSAAILWDDPYTDEAIAKERIATQALPAGYAPIHKLYESRMTITVDTVCALLNQGFGFFNHCGHGWYNALSLARGATLRNQDVNGLTNATRPGIGYSIGCWTTAFDLDAIAEHFIRNPYGGAVAFIGNSSYGWGSPGNPGFGYSDRFDFRFFKELFTDAVSRIGEVLARAKLFFVPYSFEANVYRWHQYCLNLLGDPAMPVFTDTPIPLTATKPSHLTTGENFVWLTVQDTRGPIASATVTITQNSTLLARGKTASAGTICLPVTILTDSTVRVTVTAPNHQPLEDSIPVFLHPTVSVTGYRLINPAAETTEVLSPGETHRLLLNIANTGAEPTNPTRCSISTTSPLVIFTNSAVSIPALQPQSETILTTFTLRCSPVALNGQVVPCVITLIDSTNSLYSFPLTLQIGSPVLQITGYLTTISYPDTVNLFLKLTNSGLVRAFQPSGNLFLPRPESLLPQIITPGLIFPDIAPGETVWSLTPARFIGTSPAQLGVNITANGYLFSDTLTIVFNTPGIYTNFDSGFGSWTTGGERGSWSLSSRRSHSPSFACYAGDETGVYPDLASYWLLSPRFALPPRAVLTFYRWFSLPIYGVDGLYVILITPNREDTLDFIGTGGALSEEKLGLTSSWLKESYELSAYPAGESVQIKFHFVSDQDGKTGEGFYLDDIQVTTVESPTQPNPDSFRLLRVFPNPCRNRTTIFYSLAQPSFVSLGLFDISGRKVKTLLEKEQATGWYALTWDGTDDRGNNVRSGVYFLHLKTASNLPRTTITGKLIKR